MPKHPYLRPAGWAAAVSLLFLASSISRADLLVIPPDPNSPVIASFNGSLSYNAGSHNFHSDSLPLSFTDPGHGTVLFSGGGHVSIDLSVDQNGRFLGNGGGFVLTGSLDLDNDGVVDVTGTSANPLLFGDITAFGADAAGRPTRTFDGLFAIAGGLLTQNITLSGGGSRPGGFMVGQTGGFFLFAENVTGGTLGDFTRDFSSNSVKDEEFGSVIPEPASLVLVMVGGGLLVGWRVLRKWAPEPAGGTPAG